MATFKSLTWMMVVAGVVGAPVGLAQVAQAAPCCSTDPHGSQIAAKGLGETAPLALNLSQDSTWRAYEFKRDGVWYLQVNDQAGRVRAIIGNIGDTFWTLPGGVDADRVSLPGNNLAIPAGATREVVYRKPQMWLVAYSTAGGVTWSIEGPDGSR
ncbi:hypothetical protein KQ945_08865 [Bacillus subtilis subsp. subtilis]|nr:hypothetical protein [Bacillus subtilis subsp. subtilis]